MRRILALIPLIAALAPLAAAAQDDVGFVDVVEIAGLIDRPLERYAVERIDAAEREEAVLLVFQVDSLGGVKIADDDPLPRLVRRIRDARVPVAVQVGPRDARAGGAVLLMAAAAHVFSSGPSTRVGPLHPVDLGAASRGAADEADAFRGLMAARGRPATGDPARIYLGNAVADEAGWADLIVPSVGELLRRLDGREVTTAAGTVVLDLPERGVDVRFHQPGPLRRLLHVFSNATLVYLMLLAGAMLLVFEAFQPGFGVAGFTAALLLLATIYGLTVLPASGLGLAILVGGLALFALDVARDALGPPTWLGTAGTAAGSVLVFGSGEAVAVPVWVIVLGVVSCLVVFVPVMTVVRRARHPISTQVKRALIGEQGRVRSMLNPEGFVMLDEELWRARSQDGSRMRVGEDVIVTGVEGTLLLVQAASDMPRDQAEGPSAT